MEIEQKVYGTVSDDEDCATFREIADIMSAKGEQMNHSSVRNYILRAMRKFAAELIKNNGLSMSESNIEKHATDPEFQSAIAQLLQDYYTMKGIAEANT